MWSLSCEEIQIRTHSKTTRCRIQGTEVDALRDLVVGVSSSPKPFAFTSLGEEPLAPAKPSWAIPESRSCKRLSPNPKQNCQWWHLEDVMSLHHHCVLSPWKQLSTPSSKPCSSGPQTPFLMFSWAMNILSDRIWSPIKTRFFFMSMRVPLFKNPKVTLMNLQIHHPLMLRKCNNFYMLFRYLCSYGWM